MNSVIITDYGVALGKTGDRLVVRGPRPRLELIEGGPQLFLPLGLDSQRPKLTVISSNGPKTVPPPLRAPKPGADRPLRLRPEQIEMPLFRVDEIIIGSPGVSVSADLIEACCERGIRISFLTRRGQPFAMLSSPMLTATVITRREQLAAYNDRRGVELAKSIVRGKLGNQAALLKYFGKYLKSADAGAFAGLAQIVAAIAAGRAQTAKVGAGTIDEAREALLAIEGNAGRAYWNGVRMLLAGRAEFDAREHRGATDPVNSALNYGYGILYAQVWGAIMNAGLEPFAGFLHVDRPGKPSLVLDLVEEFRQPIVDRSVIAAISRGMALQTREGMLTETSRKSIAAAVLERLEGEAAFHGRRHQLKSVIQIQARNVAAFVRGGAAYRTFAFKW
jgi:CRISP-associated protein Cas1